MTKAVEFSNVFVKLGNQIVLEDINFGLERGKFLTIIGPNGAGKTTLLKTILGLIKPFKGVVRVFGRDVNNNSGEIRGLIGYVPQKEHVSRNMPLRVWDVVMLGRSVRKGPLKMLTRGDLLAIKEALKLVNLYDLRFKKFSELSGGQQQRTLIARALVTDPKILLLDEALSGVDIMSEEIIITTLKKLLDRGITIIFVTHDINEVLEITDYVMVLKNKIIGFGKPEEVLNEKVLSKAYGSRVKVIWRGDQCFAILRDHHYA